MRIWEIVRPETGTLKPELEGETQHYEIVVKCLPDDDEPVMEVVEAEPEAEPKNPAVRLGL